MQNIFQEVASLDQRCYDTFCLSEDLLMEHAADGMADFIRSNYSKEYSITILCGKSNNGADALALARLLYKEYSLHVVLVDGVKSKMAQLQLKRLDALGINCSGEFVEADIIIDAVYGTGFKGEFSDEISQLFQKVNALHVEKLTCDVPSGLRADGTLAQNSFKAQHTLTMGALKLSLFSDAAKDHVGRIQVLDLGINREFYESDSNYKLLDESDLTLPHRSLQNTHKGTFGHLCILSGEKVGASVLSAKAALAFGAGLCTLLMHEKREIPYEIMSSSTIPSNTTAIAFGMGMGEYFNDKELEEIASMDIPKICDADIFYNKVIFTLLKQKNVVLTPHPKEFVSLLKMLSLADITVDELQKERFKYVELFSKTYEDVVLLLKGANVIIAYQKKIYVNPYGTSALAKGGSGDVLSGMIASLAAQGVDILSSTCRASLAHALAARDFKKNSYALLPEDIIENIKNL